LLLQIFNFYRKFESNLEFPFSGSFIIISKFSWGQSAIELLLCLPYQATAALACRSPARLHAPACVSLIKLLLVLLKPLALPFLSPQSRSPPSFILFTALAAGHFHAPLQFTAAAAPCSNSLHPWLRLALSHRLSLLALVLIV
jgi:hypothetical protein